MSKNPRKRKLQDEEIEIEYEVDVPKVRSRKYDQEKDEHLSHILFGDTSKFLESLEEAENTTITTSTSAVDSGVGSEDSDDNYNKKPVWLDEDDEGIDVGIALTSQHRKLPSGGINDRNNKYVDLLQNKFQTIVGKPKWAELNKQKATTDDDSDDEILRTCGFVDKSVRTSVLTPSVLEYKKVKDLNSATYAEGPYINAIEFHKTSSVALVTGNNGIATIFAVDGKRNDKLHSISFKKFPILCAKLLQNGDQAVFGSRKSFIYNYDLMAAKSLRYNLPPGVTQFKNFTSSPDSKLLASQGKFGEVHILCTLSKEKLTTLKQDTEVTALEFAPNGKHLFGHSDTGEVTIWDLNMSRVVHKFVDEGCLQGSALSIATSNQFLATGSEQGAVNIYNTTDIWKSRTPKPHKTVLNLTTSVSSVVFNPTSEILAVASNVLPKSVKLLHVNSGTVFSNFPSFNCKLGHINKVAFSPGGGYLGLGNQKSVVALYRLKHFRQY